MTGPGIAFQITGACHRLSKIKKEFNINSPKSPLENLKDLLAKADSMALTDALNARAEMISLPRENPRQEDPLPLASLEFIEPMDVRESNRTFPDVKTCLPNRDNDRQAANAPESYEKCAEPISNAVVYSPTAAYSGENQHLTESMKKLSDLLQSYRKENQSR